MAPVIDQTARPRLQSEQLIITTTRAQPLTSRWQHATVQRRMGTFNTTNAHKKIH